MSIGSCGSRRYFSRSVFCSTGACAAACTAAPGPIGRSKMERADVSTALAAAFDVPAAAATAGADSASFASSAGCHASSNVASRMPFVQMRSEAVAPMKPHSL
jgi:hypothetical protein